MTMQQFVEQQIHAMFLDLTERIANGEFGEMTDDEMCGVPMGMFKAETYMLNAWRCFEPNRANMVIVEADYD